MSTPPLTVRHILPEFGRVPLNLASSSMSGIVNVAYNLVKRQTVDGFASSLYGIPADFSVAKSEEDIHFHPVQPFSWAKVANYDFRYFIPLNLMLSFRSKADIHHVYSNPFHLAVGNAKKRILHIQTPVNEQTATPAYIKAARKADAIICCSASIRSQFLTHIPEVVDKTFVVPNGMDPDLFIPTDRQKARAALGLPQDTFIVLYAGAIIPEKGVEYLAMAAQALKQEPITFVFAGSSTLWGGASADKISPYEQKVVQMLNDTDARFLGKVNHATMPQVYAAADVFVCPSTWPEPFGMVVIEAMAAGTPVIVSNVGALPEIVTDGENGLVVSSMNAPLLAEAIRRMMKETNLGPQIAQNARSTVQKYSWSCIEEQILSIYMPLLANN